jgi:type I restriction enzyme S subunit
MFNKAARRQTLGTLCHLSYGRRVRTLAPRGYVVWNGYREVGYTTDCLLEKAEVAITCRGVGGAGNLHMTRPKSSVTDNVIVAQPKDARLDKHYLYWALFASDLTGLITGSVQHQITIRRLTRHTISIPRLKEQRQIASALDTFEEKIKLNQRTIETLKMTAESIFKSWFVDFEVVYARACGRLTSNIGAEAEALFPDSFEKSPIGDIPRGWKVARLGNLTRYLGRGIIPIYVSEGGVPVINQKCVRGHQINFDLTRRHNTAIRPVADRELQKGDVLINSTGAATLGRVAQILHLPGPLVADSHLTVVRPDPAKITRSFLAFALSAREEEMKRLGKGTTRQLELGREGIASLALVVPPLSTQNAFDDLVIPMRELSSVLLLENRLLRTVRDEMLSKLIPKANQADPANGPIVTVAPSDTSLQA